MWGQVPSRQISVTSFTLSNCRTRPSVKAYAASYLWSQTMSTQLIMWLASSSLKFCCEGTLSNACVRGTSTARVNYSLSMSIHKHLTLLLKVYSYELKTGFVDDHMSAKTSPFTLLRGNILTGVNRRTGAPAIDLKRSNPQSIFSSTCRDVL